VPQYTQCISYMKPNSVSQFTQYISFLKSLDKHFFEKEIILMGKPGKGSTLGFFFGMYL